MQMIESLETAFIGVYTKFKIQFYQRVLQRLSAREASLTTTEAYSVEIIHSLGTPTVSEFAKFVNISVANATYKVQSLIKKGYLYKQRSEADRRESYLYTTERYAEYQRLSDSYINTILRRIEQNCSPEDVAAFARVISTMNNELMPEVELHG